MQRYLKKAAQAGNIYKPASASPHTLHHSFATHIL
nr:hypothetical protein [Nitrosomonas sp. Nm51]